MISFFCGVILIIVIALTVAEGLQLPPKRLAKCITVFLCSKRKVATSYRDGCPLGSL